MNSVQLRSNIHSLIQDHSDRQTQMQEEMDRASSMLQDDNLNLGNEHREQLTKVVGQYGKMKEQALQQARMLQSIKDFVEMNDEQKISGYTDMQKAFGEIQKSN